MKGILPSDLIWPCGQRVIWFGLEESLPEVTTLLSLVVKSFVKVKMPFCQFVTLPHVGHVIKESLDFKGRSQSMSPPYLDWCPEAFCKWKYNVFNLSCDLTRPRDLRSCDFMGGNSSRNVTTLINLVTIGIVI